MGVKIKNILFKTFIQKFKEPHDYLAERVGFEPTVHCCTFDFESNTFDHSDTSPYRDTL